MEVIILADAKAVTLKASEILSALVAAKPRAVLGLATGNTPLALYKNMISAYDAGEVSFRETSTFNLDEYLGLTDDHVQSYRVYMNDNFFKHIDIKPCNTFLPTCTANENPHAAGAIYEEKIKEKGGIDLQILGLGSNGHIGFNEPSSSLSSRTRVKTLAKQTLDDNSRLFTDDEYQPQLAMTMGIASILDAKRVLLLATGHQKAAAVATMIEGALSANCPGTALQLHESVTVLIDEAAAKALKNADYYRWVHKQNEKITQKFGTRLAHEWQS